ncbi:DUF397 domain-containing protein [Streptomyces sp. NPDC003077]|uniref:DUF397 domain-containing protein n=1 Tax=Streptomyces sp. NPDC003077 TaxID=3154443 RepID=UPI0033A544DD
MSEGLWHKSSYSGGPEGECVEVAARTDGQVRLREGDVPAVVLGVSMTAWSVFVRAVKANRLDN